MKKIGLFFSILFLGFSLSTLAQDAYEGDWKVLITGTPQGDIEMIAKLARTDGNLEGTMTPVKDGDVIAIDKIEESSDKLVLYFSAQGYDLNLDLTKVDESHLEGTLMNMFEAKAEKMMNDDFFAGKWQILIEGTPNGDYNLVGDLTRVNGNLTGVLLGSDGNTIKLDKVTETADDITLYFFAEGYDLDLKLKKVDADNLKGNLMGSFNSSAQRIK